MIYKEKSKINWC